MVWTDEFFEYSRNLLLIFFSKYKTETANRGQRARDSCLKINKYYVIFVNSTIRHIPNSFFLWETRDIYFDIYLYLNHYNLQYLFFKPFFVKITHCFSLSILKLGKCNNLCKYHIQLKHQLAKSNNIISNHGQSFGWFHLHSRFR